MIENTNTKQFYPGPILNNTLEITDFLFNDAEQIKIKHSKLNEEGILIDIDLNYPTDYEVTKVLPSDINAAEAALTASTGQIMLKNINVLAGEKLTVYRVSQIIQDKDYPRTGAFPAATHEGALDYLTMQNQEQKDEIDRALKVPISTQNFEGSLPLPIPSRALKINNDGTGFEMSEFDPDLALVTTEEFKNQSQQAAAEALASQNIATEQATIATQQAGIATEKTAEVIESGTTAVQNIDTAFSAASEWFSKLNAIPYIPVGTILPTTGAIDESLGYQRYANGQLIANVSSQAPDLVKFLEFQEAHAPNLLCSETEWQTALTLSTLGQVGKYVWNKEEDSIRIPRIVNIQGMMDMNTVGNMVEAGLPNITGATNQTVSGNTSDWTTEWIGAIKTSFINSTGVGLTEKAWSERRLTSSVSLDASHLNPIYGNSNTVQEESILYPYVLQIATGVQYKTPVQNELERIVPYSFGNHKYSNVLLNNPAWMRSVGQWNSAKTHGDYYNWLVEERRNPKDIPARANVTKVGNIIDNAGVLSGFSTSNYAQIEPLQSMALPYKLHFTFTTFDFNPADSSTYAGYLYSTGVVNSQGLLRGLRISVGKSDATNLPIITCDYSFDGTSLAGALTSTTIIQPNTTYTLDFIFTGQRYELYLNENLERILENSTPLPQPIKAYIGVWEGSGISYPWLGAIDLNESYINIDGQRWWSGMKSPVRLHTEDYGPEDWVINQSEQTFRLPLVADRVLVDKTEGINNYRLYSDGYLEQEGIGDYGSDARSVTIRTTLLKPYINTTYYRLATPSRMAAQNASMCCAFRDITNTSFELIAYGFGTTDLARYISWQTSGYTEIPTEEKRTMNKYLYFYVGGVAKNEHLVDVGRIEEKLVDKANKTDVDGQWVLPDKDIVLNSSTAVGAYIIDLSEYLPNDGYKYEIYGSLYISRDDSSGTNSNVFVDEIINGVPRATHSAWIIADGTNFQQGLGTYIAVVDNSRSVRLRIEVVALKVQQIRLTKYRRLGTNV